jgi:hypothetical protein
VGRGSSALSKNILTMKNNGDLNVSGRITDGENLNTDIWKTVYSKPCNAAKTFYYNLIDYYNLPFEPSELI